MKTTRTRRTAPAGVAAEITNAAAHRPVRRTEPDRAEAKRVLEEIVNRARGGVEKTLETIEKNHPTDVLAPFGAMHVERRKDSPSLLDLVIESTPKAIATGELHDNAMTQLAAMGGLPVQYVRQLSDEPWGVDLVAHNFNTLLPHMEGRALVRTANGQRRGILSPSYRRIDSRPIADKIVTVANELGGLPIDARYNDVRVSLRVIAPKLYEVTPGEWVVVGFDWRDSDYGKGANEIDEFMLRLVCMNGATMAEVSRQVHLGKRLTADIFSDETYRLDTAATVSAMGDVVRHALSSGQTDKIVANVKAAAEAPFDAKAAQAALKKVASKEEIEGIVKLYTSADIVMLPPGDTAWRWSNAISRFAGTAAANVDRVLELNDVAGQVILQAAA